MDEVNQWCANPDHSRCMMTGSGKLIHRPYPDVEVTVTMRVPMSESTYRKLKAAASLRGVGQGQLAAQIIEEQLGGYMNFGPGGESFPFERNQMPGSDV